MAKLVIYTYVGLFAMYMAAFHIDSQIIYPYKPFKIIRPTNLISKKLVFCKDKKRGMVSIAFILEMFAHSLLLLLSFFLIIVYCNNWYLIDEFPIIYKNIIICIIFWGFGVPGIIAISVHKYTVRKEVSKNRNTGDG